MTEFIALTDEQQKVVDHKNGPALVLAVAGSGKTTCLVQRIEKLVKVHKIKPERILATTFNRAAAADINKKLSQRGLQGVAAKTLHSVGYNIIRVAQDKRFISTFPELTETSLHLIRNAISDLKRTLKGELNELNISEDDLEAFIGECKGNMRYADLETHLSCFDFPPEAVKLMEQASHENPAFVEGFRLYEKYRTQNNQITFDDQLLLGWECLVRYEELRDHFQRCYDYIIVDEFQDLNKVQYYIIDILQKLHNNYMAIGDDDQCIYQWRGASPGFILNFKEKYKAEQYCISDNFRSTAQQTFLANKSININKNRLDKTVNLSKDFNGNTTIKSFNNSLDEATEIVQLIQSLRKSDDDYSNLAILIRAWGDSTSLQALMLQKGIKFDLDGNDFFFERLEIRTLLNYLKFCIIEMKFSETAQNSNSLSLYSKYFLNIMINPTKYVSSQELNNLISLCQSKRIPITEIIENDKDILEKRPKLNQFLKLIEVIKHFIFENSPVNFIIDHIINETEYYRHLKAISGTSTLSEERIRSTKAFLEYCLGKGTARELLDKLFQLSQEKKEDAQIDKSKWLKVTTIHRSKGLDWDIVFLPACNSNSFPPGKAKSSEEMEAERRLFYVALTRAKRSLYISYIKEGQESPFLKEINYPDILNDANALNMVYTKDVEKLDEEDLFILAESTKKYSLSRYWMHWSKYRESQNIIKAKLSKLSLVCTEAVKSRNVYLDSTEKYSRDLEVWNAKRAFTDNSQSYTAIRVSHNKVYVGQELEIQKNTERIELHFSGKKIGVISGYKLDEDVRHGILKHKYAVVDKVDGQGSFSVRLKPTVTINPLIDHQIHSGEILVCKISDKKYPTGTSLKIVKHDKAIKFLSSGSIIGTLDHDIEKYLPLIADHTEATLLRYTNSGKNFWIKLKTQNTSQPIPIDHNEAVRKPEAPKPLSEKNSKYATKTFYESFNIFAKLFDAPELIHADTILEIDQLHDKLPYDLNRRKSTRRRSRGQLPF